MNHWSPLFLALVFTFLPAVSNAQTPPAAAQAAATENCESSADQIAIYSLVLQQVLLKGAPPQYRIELLSRTSGGYPPGMAALTSFGAKERQDLLDAADQATKDDFDAKIKLQCNLATNIQPTGRIDFLDYSKLDSLFPDGVVDWKQFGKAHPKNSGITLVSSIGFNAAKDQALVYMGNSCGITCGSGYLVLLSKQNDHWSIRKTANIWVS